MKKIIILLSFVFVIALSFACEESFSPKTDFTEQYVLNCILHGDLSKQVATLTRLYEVDAYDPYENRIDPAVTSADIRIYYDNSVYYLRDSTILRNDTSRYNTPVHFYYTENLKPELNKTISIRAQLASGEVLSSTIHTINSDLIYFLGSTTNIPNYAEEFITVRFFTISGDVDFSRIYFMPRLNIKYSKIENGEQKFYYKQVPQYYETVADDVIPFYPKPSNRDTYYFENEAFDITMDEIAENDYDRSAYIIHDAVFTLYIPDENFSEYYMAENTYNESFSIKLDPPRFSNIEGGLGIFGCFVVLTYEIPISANYIRNFGYTPGQ